MNKIKTSNGTYEYNEGVFQNGVKGINREISKDNLLDLKKCFDKRNIKFGLIYGTLLGAIREENFIEHDEDTDIFMLQENKPMLLDVLFELRNIGFEVGRHTDELTSIIRNGEYIDIYSFKKKGINTRECDGYIIKNVFLENLEEYEFLGTMFNVPQDTEKLLVHLYGKDWKIPKENTPASNYGVYLKIKFFLKNNFRLLFKMISRAKQKSNV